jgi:hypothetical protein
VVPHATRNTVFSVTCARFARFNGSNGGLVSARNTIGKFQEGVRGPDLGCLPQASHVVHDYLVFLMIT